MAALYKELPEQSIRLFELDYAADKNEPLSGKLVTTKLAPKLKYNALSYVWGKANSERVIKVSGVEIRISRNLDRALRQIRGVCGALSIWVDQICINGENADEKARQVRLMGQIYSSAQEVLVILCTCNLIEDESRKILPSCFPRLIELSRLPLETHRRDTCFESGSEGDAFLMQGPIGCQWWARMWTAQELLFAQRLKFFYHGDNISADVLQHFCNWYDLHMTSCCRVGSSFSGMLHVEISDLVSRARKIFAVRQNITKRREPMGLLEALIKTHGRYSANPLDQIYALASLTRIPAVLIDYNITPQKCYTAFAKYIIESSGCLDIFEHLDGLPSLKCLLEWVHQDETNGDQNSKSVGDHETGGLDHLPSWVPDWSIIRNGPGHKALSLYHQNLDNYLAAANTTVRMSMASDTSLILRGVNCGAIVKTSPVFAEMDFTSAAILGIWAAIGGIESIESKEYVTDSIFTEGHYLDLSDKLLGFQGASMSTFISLIEMRKNGRYNHMNPRLTKLRKEDFRAKLLYKEAHWKFAGADEDSASQLLQSLESDGAEEDKILALTNSIIFKLHLLRKHLITTSDGKFGVASTQTKAGDLVCVLYGGRTPFILREERQQQSQPDIEDFDHASRLNGQGLKSELSETRQYRIIGEAYIQRLMLGEAVQDLEEGRLTEEDFVLV